MNPEIIGIIATLFVLLSFMMKEAKAIRCINIIGAILFVAYGLMIGAFSTWLLNAVLIVIHAIYLIKK